MANYPFLVNAAWYVIGQFLEEWQKEPYRWSNEIEIQAALYGRLTTVYSLIGRDSFIANYGNAVSGFENNQKWNRVSCEPPLQYTFKDGKKYKCYPDIVIWDDIDNPNSPPDKKDDVNFPILLTLEIKLYGQLDKKNNNWDIEKMGYLLKQGDTKYACWINFTWTRTDTGSGISWRLSDHKKLWICEAKLPPLEKPLE